MTSIETELLPAVDPIRLASAYEHCADMFEEIMPDGSIDTTAILSELDRTQQFFDNEETIDIFRRLCLTVQLVGDVDANWSDVQSGQRPSELPFAFFELAGSETAFEEVSEGYGSIFFARCILDEAFSAFRPN